MDSRFYFLINTYIDNPLLFNIEDLENIEDNSEENIDSDNDR